jgi:cell division protein FtsZ
MKPCWIPLRVPTNGSAGGSNRSGRCCIKHRPDQSGFRHPAPGRLPAAQWQDTLRAWLRCGRAAVADSIESLKLCPLLATPEFSRKADRLLVNITGGPDLTLPKVNEIMTAVTEQFGRDSHVIMGAVIDETMQGRVEICVLGTSDLGGRMSPRRLSPAARNKGSLPRFWRLFAVRMPLPFQAMPGSERWVAPWKPTNRGRPSPTQPMLPLDLSAPKGQQNEFSFNELESRGYFDKTDRNLFEGQDLDVPTYLRKGIKIAL